MTTTDPFAEFKAAQRSGWSHFAPLQAFTTPVASHLVRFAEVKTGQRVLDVGTGTGVVAITARALGAQVAALDLTPELLAHAQENAAASGVGGVEWREGDAESLPYPDGSFDVVLSQFGHMFAPRAQVVTRELLRVLRPGGRLAFATWPPEHMIGQMFALVSRYLPPPPGVTPTPSWGDPSVVRERLGDAVRGVFFERGVMRVPAFTPAHYRVHMEQSAGPVLKLVAQLASSPDKLAAFRAEIEELTRPYWEDNTIRQEYLLTRAVKV